MNWVTTFPDNGGKPPTNARSHGRTDRRSPVLRALPISLTGTIQQKLILWKTNMEGKGLRVNMGKTKVLISGPRLDVLQKSGKDICGVCLKGVRANSIFCGGCSSWIHKKYTGISGPLKPGVSFSCKRCTGNARPIDGRPVKVVG